MPVIAITLLPGYGAETESRLVQRVALAARSVIAAPAAGTTVMVHHASTYQRDGRVVTAGGAARPDASALVRRFLDHMQARELTQAQQFLAPEFVMRFPGGATLHRLEDLVQWAKTRYQRVAKVFDQFDECWTDNGAVVYCAGTLEGVWPDGSVFAGVRFIDRFVLMDGLIRQQDVWNDLAEARPVEP